MARLPFNPQRARGAEQPRPPADRPLTVAQAVDLINRALIDNLPPKVRIVGEISNLSNRGHLYFSLKDDNAVLRCVAWASKARTFGFEPDNGMSVVATGSIQFYGPQGQTQLYVDKLEPVGAGALELRFRALCEELRGLGYFDEARKKPLPIFPRKVAVVTSAQGAALQDVLDTMRRRCPAVGVVVVDVLVQGPQAAPGIAAALKHLAKHHERLGIDAVLLTRGGGSIEDLWAFNERIVADALLNFPIPTVAAIGHETDTTIAELVADCRCATPTQAAMRLTPDRRELLAQLDQTQRRMWMQLDHRIRYARQRLRTAQTQLGRPADLVERATVRLNGSTRHLREAMRSRLHGEHLRLHRLAARLERVRPERVAAERTRRLELIAYRLDASVAHRLRRFESQLAATATSLDCAPGILLQRHRDALDRAEAVLRGLDPSSVLHRGYSITRRADGTIIRSISTVTPGDRLHTHVADGSIESDVAGQTPADMKRKDGNEDIDRFAPTPALPRRAGGGRKGRRPIPPGQMDLFDRAC